MEKRQMLWKTKGMNKDLSVSAFNPEFAFENMNLRVSTNEKNTLMSWVNEKGTEEITITITIPSDGEPQTTHTISGIPIGTAVIDHKLVLFTTTLEDPDSVTPGTDRIYVIEKGGDAWKGNLLFTGNLKFDTQHPLETLVSYEMEDVQKVYWVDGKNQPRVINICKDFEINPSNEYYSKFDFVSELQLNETVNVQKLYGGGRFAPGVIQYAFTYYNKYGQESNIFYTTPLYYVSFIDRAGSPDAMVDNAFKITVSDLDPNYEYLRIYSIQRTSLDDVPIVKRLQDIDIHNFNPGASAITTSTKEVSSIAGVDLENPNIEINNPMQGPLSSIAGYDSDVSWMGYRKANNENLVIQVSDGYITWGAGSTEDSCIWVSSEVSNRRCICGTTDENGDQDTCSLQDFKFRSVPFGDIFYVDTGLTGDTVDPTELLYKGGNSTIPSSIEQKDNTLFFGNLQLEETYIGGIEVSSNPTAYLKDSIKTTPITCGTRSLNTKLISSGSYTYYNQLNGKNCAGFKKSNYYRLGVQFQYKTGKWGEPLFISDVQQTEHFTTQGNILNAPVFTGSLSSSVSSALITNGYRKARAVVVYPNQNDRVVICQGVAAPTVYTQEHRTYGTNSEKGNNDLYAQSSWFFRTKLPVAGEAYTEMVEHYDNVGTVPPAGTGVLKYAERGVDPQDQTTGSYDPSQHKRVEIQGCYNDHNKFEVAWNFLTLHFPDVEFDTALYYTDLSSVSCYSVGDIEFTNTLSDISIQTESPTISSNGSGVIHKSFSDINTFGIVSGLFYDDYGVDDIDEDFLKFTDEQSSLKWSVYPWNKTGSLNNDINRPAGKGIASAILKKKKISNLRFAETNYNIGASDVQKKLQGIPQLFSSDQVSIVKVDGKIYQGNIDTILTPDFSDGQYFAFNDINPDTNIADPDIETPFTSTTWWKTFSTDPDEAEDNGLWKYNSGNHTWEKKRGQAGNEYVELVMKKELVRMKYKSTPHVAFMVSDNILSDLNNYSLPIVEFRRQIDTNTIFGGQSEDALKANVWVPCGEPVALNPYGTEIEYSYGDTYYQRYDCLKTYAFTPEDENQVIEIGSFMLETYVNIEGRYDRNRGQKSNVDMSPLNFNLHNPVYSQQDNFFTYKIVSDESSVFTYPNQVTWSLTKTPGADVDAWTNMSLGSTLELDGDKGSITKLIKLNDRLLAFQDSGISQIMYNENVQVSTEQGVPIEIANSGKVQGARYLSNTIGCSNKWSMAQTPAGIYFMDSNDKSIYLLGEGLKNVTLEQGFNTWAKQEIKKGDGFKAFYDKLNQEVLFINEKKALAWSEKIGTFTSFYSYGGAPYFVNLDDEGLWINRSNIANGNDGSFKLWKHQGGDYGRFFDVNEPYWTVLVGNPNPQMDKTFTNLEFRACIDRDGKQSQTSSGFDFALPFDSLEVWNEYQHGETALSIKSGHATALHVGKDSALNRKFRIWRCDIPRDNWDVCLRPNPLPVDPAPTQEEIAAYEEAMTAYNDEVDKGIYRYNKHPLDRMRNPWIYLKLMREAAEPSSTLDRCEIHDMMMNYFV